MFESARDFLSRFRADERLLLAVSGGGDSFAALKWLAQQDSLRLRLVVAHVNHGLRDDAAYVASLVCRQAARFGVECEVANVDVPAALSKRAESVEACARRLRYAALEELRRRLDCSFIVTAHTLDDDAETVAMRLNFNSTWYECTGIPRQTDRILRPFLRMTRRQLRSVITDEDEIDSDPMNADFRFPRVRMRSSLSMFGGDCPELPYALSSHGAYIERLLTLTTRLCKQHINNILESQTSPLCSLVIVSKNLYLEDLDFVQVERAASQLAGGKRTRLSSSTRRAITQFLQAEGRVAVLPLVEGISLRRAGRHVWVQREEQHEFTCSDAHHVSTPDTFCKTKSGEIFLTRRLAPNLNVRRWLPGERFRPALRRTRKVATWLADAGVHPAVRADWPVITCQDRIVAIPGLGASAEATPLCDEESIRIHWKSISLCDQQLSR